MRRRPCTQVNRNAPGLFFLLPPAEQRERIVKLAKSRLTAATIASMVGLQVSAIERIVAETIDARAVKS